MPFSDLHLPHHQCYRMIAEQVNWPYQNCFRHGCGMASDRMASYTYNGSWFGFAPPQTIALNAALSSCYARFRSVAKYILAIDTDEFIAFNPSAASRHHHGRSPGFNINRLVDFADSFFAAHPTLPALKFTPVLKLDCHTGSATSLTNTNAEKNAADNTNVGSSTKASSGNSTRDRTCIEKNPRPPFVLPRLDKWVYNDIWRGNLHEGKLLMRTDAVRNFYVHFVTQLEPGQTWVSIREDPSIIYVNRSIAVLMHYKLNPKMTKDIWGSTLYISEDLRKFEVIGLDVCDLWGIKLQFGDVGKGNKSSVGQGLLDREAVIVGDPSSTLFNKSSSLLAQSSSGSDLHPVFCPSRITTNTTTPSQKRSMHDRFFAYLTNKTSTISSNRTLLWYAQYSDEQQEPQDYMEHFPMDCIAGFHQSIHADAHDSGANAHQNIQCIPSYTSALFQQMFRRFRARMKKKAPHHLHHLRKNHHPPRRQSTY